MLEAGDYLFINAGFSATSQPFITLQKDDTLYDLIPFYTMLSLQFDLTTCYCTGWRDIASGEQFACPDHSKATAHYEQCRACQNRTGFNPAFYHATHVSKQQEARNRQPHFLYIAHFGPQVVKVGISYAARNTARLLEQGARSALIIDTFPTALIARQYEARSTTLAGVVETIHLRKKLALVTQPYDPVVAAKELDTLHTLITEHLSLSAPKNPTLQFDQIYFPQGTPSLQEAYNLAQQHRISGQVVGMIGSILFCQHQGRLLFLPLKQYTGYKVTLSYGDLPIELPHHQATLF